MRKVRTVSLEKVQTKTLEPKQKTEHDLNARHKDENIPQRDGEACRQRIAPAVDGKPATPPRARLDGKSTSNGEKCF